MCCLGLVNKVHSYSFCIAISDTTDDGKPSLPVIRHAAKCNGCTCHYWYYKLLTQVRKLITWLKNLAN